MPGPRAATALAVVALLAPRAARAAAFRVESRTEAHAYCLRAFRATGTATACYRAVPDADAGNPSVLARRRIVQSLGVSGIELVRGEDLSFDASLRLWIDFGVGAEESSRLDSYPVSDADLLYAYASWKELYGVLDLRLGRQVFVDELDFASFDGARVAARIGRVAMIEAYGGLEVKGAYFLGSAAFQPDGTRETDARRLLQEASPGSLGASPVLDRPALLYGLRASAALWRVGDARLGYRRTVVDGKTETEHAGASVRLRPIGRTNVYAGGDLNLHLGSLTRGVLGASWVGDFVTVTGEAQRIAPSFTADSIWAYFAFAPRDEARLRVDLTPPLGSVRLFVEGSNQRYRTALKEALRDQIAVSPDPIDSGVTFGGRIGAGLLPPERLRADVELSARAGWAGRQIWLDLHAGVDALRDRLAIDARITIADVADGLTPWLRGTMVGGSLQAAWRLADGVTITGLVEDNLGPFTRQDFRVYAILDVRVDR